MFKMKQFFVFKDMLSGVKTLHNGTAGQLKLLNSLVGRYECAVFRINQ